MSSIQYRLKKRLYRLKAYRRKGFGIHSPYTFNLITNVVEAKLHYYAFEKLQKTRKLAGKLLKSSCKSSAISMGRANFLKDEIYNLKKGEAADRLVFRLMNFSRAEKPAYIGDGLAYTTAYMASVDSRIKVSCIGECIKNGELHAKIFQDQLRIDNVQSAKILEIKEVDFMVISDRISDEDLENFLTNYPNKLKSTCMLVFLNMYKAPKLLNCWKKLKGDTFFKLSLDLFHVGILVAREGMKKQDYVRKYRF